MRSAGLRNKPIDRRYLNKRDRSDYNQSGAYGRDAQALARARAYRGSEAYQRNRPPATTTRRGGTGGFSPGLGIQAMRNAEQGRKSQFSVKPPSKLGDIFGDK